MLRDRNSYNTQSLMDVTFAGTVQFRHDSRITDSSLSLNFIVSVIYELTSCSQNEAIRRPIQALQPVPNLKPTARLELITTDPPRQYQTPSQCQARLLDRETSQERDTTTTRHAQPIRRDAPAPPIHDRRRKKQSTTLAIRNSSRSCLNSNLDIHAQLSHPRERRSWEIKDRGTSRQEHGFVGASTRYDGKEDRY